MDIRSFLIKKKSDEDNASVVLEPHTWKSTSVSAQGNLFIYSYGNYYLFIYLNYSVHNLI